VDRAAIDVRMEQIIAPKLDWCFDVYAQGGKRTPARVVDVGAGGGHFLAGALRRGLGVEGFEKSRASRAFAKEAFGLALRSDDFGTASIAPVDLVTFWGLLEYVQRPRELLAAARRALAPDGLLVVEVPRVDALGTMVQGEDGAVVARHMDPTSHVNAFSDESLCTALVEEGFRPVAAWYFGMDAWEFVVQAALRAGDDSLVGRLAEGIPMLQRALDRGRQCDDIVVAARRLER
jgi:SAM-dependent methyltransferase